MDACAYECRQRRRQYLSNGQKLTHADRRANKRADSEAKVAAAVYSVSAKTRLKLLAHNQVVRQTAQWLGQVTYAATNFGSPSTRDSEASRAQAEAHRRSKRRSTWKLRPKRPLLRQQPHNSAMRAQAWTQKAKETAGGPLHSDSFTHRDHKLMMSDNVVWCCVCGSFGTLRGRGLAKACPGPLPPGKAGGRAQQLRKLLAGVHPKDGTQLGDAIPQHRWSAVDTLLLAKGAYHGDSAQPSLTTTTASSVPAGAQKQGCYTAILTPTSAQFPAAGAFCPGVRRHGQTMEARR